MARKIADCRDFPDQKVKCSLSISGEEDEVMKAAIDHAASVHGIKDSPEFREEMKKMLKDEPRSRGSEYAFT